MKIFLRGKFAFLRLLHTFYLMPASSIVAGVTNGYSVTVNTFFSFCIDDISILNKDVLIKRMANIKLQLLGTFDMPFSMRDN